GGFYDHESVTDRRTQKAFDTSYQPIAPFAPQLDPESLLSTFEARAFYGEMTWRISDRLDVTGGLRHDHNDQEFSVFVSGAPAASGQGSDGVATWTAAARYRITPSVMLYGRVATGTLPGVPNDISFSRPETLPSYAAGLTSESLDQQGF